MILAVFEMARKLLGDTRDLKRGLKCMQVAIVLGGLRLMTLPQAQ